MAQRFAYFVLSLVLVACTKGQLEPHFVPASGKSDVPVNAVVHTFYIGEKPIRKSDINQNNFRLTACSSGSAEENSNTDSSQTGSQDSSQTNNNQNNTQKQTTASSEGKAVSGRLWSRSFQFVEQEEAGSTQKYQTDIYFIPFGESGSATPLEENMRYCFEAAVVKDEDGKAALSGKIVFSTEDSSSFVFADLEESLAAEIVNEEQITGPVSPKEMILVRFPGRSVNPNDFLNGTKLCDLGSSGSTPQENRNRPSDTNECGYGYSDRRKVYLIEAFDESDGVETASFSMFAIGGNFTPDHDYRLRLGLGTSGATSEDVSQIDDIPLSIGSEEIEPNQISALLEESEVGPAHSAQIPLTGSKKGQK